MNKKYICTCGTSIGNGLRGFDNGLAQEQSSMFDHTGLYKDAYDKDANKYQEKILEKISHLKQKYRNNVTELAHNLGAEISLLHELKLDDNDKVILFISDTVQGRICGEIIKKNVSLICPNQSKPEVILKVISGFNLHDKSTTVKQGMEQLISMALMEIDDAGYDIILAPLGGYKAMVSYLTIVGMLYNKPTVYMFEHINQLFFMPALPFSFDINVYAKAENAIQKILDGEQLKEYDFLNCIEGYEAKNDPYNYEKNLYLSFTEVLSDGETLGVSALASILFDLDEAKHKIKISQKAKKEYDKLPAGTTKDRVTKLIKLSSQKLLRTNCMKPFKSSDLLRIGPSGPPERIAGYLIESEFYVTHIFTTHDAYERDLGKSRKADFPEKVFVDFN